MVCPQGLAWQTRTVFDLCLLSPRGKTKIQWRANFSINLGYIVMFACCAEEIIWLRTWPHYEIAPNAICKENQGPRYNFCRLRQTLKRHSTLSFRPQSGNKKPRVLWSQNGRCFGCRKSCSSRTSANFSQSSVFHASYRVFDKKNIEEKNRGHSLIRHG